MTCGVFVFELEHDAIVVRLLHLEVDDRALDDEEADVDATLLDLEGRPREALRAVSECDFLNF